MTPPGLAPTFYRVVTPDGIALVYVDRTEWPDHLAITHQLIEDADPDYITTGDGMLRFYSDAGGGALYGFAHDCRNVPRVGHYDLISTEKEKR